MDSSDYIIAPSSSECIQNLKKEKKKEQHANDEDPKGRNEAAHAKLRG